jgi:hypothetical protein
MEMRPQRRDPACLVGVEPPLAGVRVAGSQEPVLSDGMGTHAVADLHERGAPLP